MTHPPDERLLERARHDADAFAALYDRHAPGVAQWLRRRTDSETARELLAETWAEAWAARARFNPRKGSAKAWLYAIARHQLLHFYRDREVERRARRRLGLEVTFAEEDADARIDAQALRAELEALLDGLAPAVREAVVLRAVEQLDHREIAARLGCSPQAARLRVSRGLRALRAAWDAEPAPVARLQEGVLT